MTRYYTLQAISLLCGMASQNATVEEPPPLQAVQAAEQEKKPILVEGCFQSCEGHIQRRSKILKRWKKEYIKVIPGIELNSRLY